jgi:hypothetical protein
MKKHLHIRLETALLDDIARYRAAQPVAPTITGIVEAALRDWLSRQTDKARGQR